MSTTGFSPFFYSVALVFVGASLTWITDRLTERRRLEAERQANLQSAYAGWFTMQDMLVTHMRLLCTIITENLDDWTTERGGLVESGKLSANLQALLEHNYKLQLLETDSARLGMIKDTISILKFIFTRVQKYAVLDRRYSKLQERVNKQQEYLKEHPRKAASMGLDVRTGEIEDQVQSERETLRQAMGKIFRQIEKLLDRITVQSDKLLRLLSEDRV